MRISIDHPEALEQSIRTINSGGLLVYPTDTLYGLGVDATNGTAVDKINALKKRQGPISVIAPDVKTALSWTNLPHQDYKLVRPYLGGQQTAILPVKTGLVAGKITGPDLTLGIRIPEQNFILELALRTGVPITTTSVNRSGQPPMNDPDSIWEMFSTEIDLLIDGGPLAPSRGSKIFKWQNRRMISIR